jgi:hypothetical protein
MGGSNSEVKIHPTNGQKCCEQKFIFHFLDTKGNQIRFCPIYLWILTDFTTTYSTIIDLAPQVQVQLNKYRYSSTQVQLYKYRYSSTKTVSLV